MNEIFSSYFDPESSMEASGAGLHDVLSTIAARYIGQNPPHAFRFRAFSTDSFMPNKDGRYELNLNEKLPASMNGQYALIAARFQKDQKEVHTILLGCYSEVTLYFNGEEIWHSTSREEVDADIITTIDLPCKKGWNNLLFCCKKSASGFGCVMGPQMPNWRWIPFLTPFSGRRGQGGFVYSEAVDTLPVNLADLEIDGDEVKSGLKWFPEYCPKKDSSSKGDFGKVFGLHPDKWAYAWSLLEQGLPGTRKILFHFSGADFYLDGEKLNIGEKEIAAGEHDLVIVSQCPQQGKWDFTFSAQYTEGGSLVQNLPKQITGTSGQYIFLGLFTGKPEYQSPTLYGLFGDDEKIYWRTEESNRVLRPYLENTCFGRWNYPLGVTLYGLTQTARVLGRQDITNYVNKHIQECVSMYDYSLWDRKTYGYPELNNQIVELKSLDDCGSFASAMLEFYKDNPDENIHRLADRIANHISFKQERREDGAFYRLGNNHPTLWVDDLYMSIPFLCRYTKLSENPKYLDDALQQVLLFKKYLFLPEHGIMSHVYDFKHNTDTKVPWGRGNGWCLFSISELLEVLPKTHSKRPTLLEFFTQLCEGYLALQGSRGLWHQVLTHPESYEESSCTAMFTYAFSRAIRFEWVNEDLSKRLLQAVKKAWKGLCSVSIDRWGNIYGICRGSSYSFMPDYYKDVLGWTLNDTHGTGIVLLAGIEVEKCNSLTMDS